MSSDEAALSMGLSEGEFIGCAAQDLSKKGRCPWEIEFWYLCPFMMDGVGRAQECRKQTRRKPALRLPPFQ